MIPHPWILVSAGFHRHGGQSKANYYLVQYLLQNNHRVYLIGHDFDHDLTIDPRVHVYSLARPFGKDILGNWFLYHQGRSIIKKIEKRENQTCRVIVNGGNCVWRDVNWVHYIHSVWQPKITNSTWLYRWKESIAGKIYRRREQKSFRTATILIANSECTRKDLIQMGCHSQRVKTIYLGCDPDWSIPTENERKTARRAIISVEDNRPLLGFVGGVGLDNRKGFDILVSAFEQLCTNKNWNGDLVIAGAGNGLSFWQQKLSQSPFRHRYHFLGFTKDVKEVLASLDLLISPVRYEPYGLNVQEAICRGVPSIVSQLAGIAEQYPPDCHPLLLNDANSVNELADKIERWWQNANEWKERFIHFSENLRRNTWSNMAKNMVSYFENFSLRS